MLCPRCGNEYDDQDRYVLCGKDGNDCYSEVGLYGDTENFKAWASWKTLVNSKLTPDELETFSECEPILDLYMDIIDRMDYRYRVRLIDKLFKLYIEK